MSPNEQRQVRGTKQADTFGVVAARHLARLASRSPLLLCMHASMKGLPDGLAAVFYRLLDRKGAGD